MLRRLRCVSLAQHFDAYRKWTIRDLQSGCRSSPHQSPRRNIRTLEQGNMKHHESQKCRPRKGLMTIDVTCQQGIGRVICEILPTARRNTKADSKTQRRQDAKTTHSFVIKCPRVLSRLAQCVGFQLIHLHVQGILLQVAPSHQLMRQSPDIALFRGEVFASNY